MHFIGTKIVIGLAMTRLAYNEYRGWDLPANENGADEGYLVEYLDGGKPNHPAHTGYISWSPKEQFEGANIGFEIPEGLPAFQLRMYGEKARLESDLSKITAFIGSEKFADIHPSVQDAMGRQEQAMKDYLKSLSDRLALLAPHQPTK